MKSIQFVLSIVYIVKNIKNISRGNVKKESITRFLSVLILWPHGINIKREIAKSTQLINNCRKYAVTTDGSI